MAKKFNAYTGKWEDTYGPEKKASSGGGASGGSSGGAKKQTPKPTPKATNKPKPKPDKPVKPDKGNAHKGSGTKKKAEAVAKSRAIEYDLEGTATINPIREIKSKQTIDFGGLGGNFSGKYFINTVVHTINRGGYTMQLDVIRNNFVWKADAPKKDTKPKVPPKKEPNKKPKSYTIKKGDTLWAIAKRYYGKGTQYPKIFNANKGKIKNPHLIFPGQKITIP